MTGRRRRFTADFKARVALEALRGDRTIQEIAARHQVHPNITRWTMRSFRVGIPSGRFLPLAFGI